MVVPGKLELTIKMNVLPTDVSIDKNGWKSFVVDCDGHTVQIAMKPKVFAKLTDAAANWPQWVAAIAGSMGPRTETGFVLLEPNVQVFERKPKEPKPSGAAPTEGGSNPNGPSGSMPSGA